MEGMSDKHKQFCTEYLIDMNGTRAYKEVYGDVTDNTARTNGSRLLAKANIQSYLKKKLEEVRLNNIADVIEIEEYLTSLIRGKESEETLIGTGKGKQALTDIKVSAKDRIRAAELLGRRYAMFTDKVEHECDLGLQLVVDYGEDQENPV